MIRRWWYGIRWYSGSPPRAVEVLGALATVSILWAATCVFLGASPAHGEPIMGEVDGTDVCRAGCPTYDTATARAVIPGRLGVAQQPLSAPERTAMPQASTGAWGCGLPWRTTQPTGQIQWAGRAKVTSYGDRWEHEVPWDCEGRPLRVGVCAANPEIALDTILWVQGIPRCVRVRDRGGKVKLGYTSSSENANLDIYTLRPVGTRRGVPWAPVQPPHRRRAHDAGRCAPGRALPAP